MSGWNPPFLFSRLVLSGTRYLGHVPPALGALMFSFCSLFLEGHKDSVTCAGFSHDSTLVATGDMSGLLKVWQVDTKEEVWSFEAGDLEVRSSKWDSTLGVALGRGRELGGPVPPLPDQAITEPVHFRGTARVPVHVT